MTDHRLDRIMNARFSPEQTRIALNWAVKFPQLTGDQVVEMVTEYVDRDGYATAQAGFGQPSRSSRLSLADAMRVRYGLAPKPEGEAATEPQPGHLVTALADAMRRLHGVAG